MLPLAAASHVPWSPHQVRLFAAVLPDLFSTSYGSALRLGSAVTRRTTISLTARHHALLNQSSSAFTSPHHCRPLGHRMPPGTRDLRCTWSSEAGLPTVGMETAWDPQEPQHQGLSAAQAKSVSQVCFVRKTPQSGLWAVKSREHDQGHLSELASEIHVPMRLPQSSPSSCS